MNSNVKQSEPLCLQGPTPTRILFRGLFEKAEYCPKGSTLLPPYVLDVPGLLDLKA